MASIEHSTELKVEHLLSRVKQLSPAELDEFTRNFARWQQQRKTSIGEEGDAETSAAEVLAFIRANSQLPETENRQYWQLQRKADDETLSDAELPKYQELVQRLTVPNTKRIEGMTILAQRQGKPVREIRVEFGLKAGNDRF